MSDDSKDDSEPQDKLKSDDYEIGFRKPPAKSRFKPGSSGNPKGRPRGSKNKTSLKEETKLSDIIFEIANQKISVQEKDKKVNITMAEAMVRSLAIKAVKGDTRSQRIFLNLKDKVDEKREKEITDTVDVAFKYKTFWEKTLEQWKLHNIVRDDPIPHPDDIIVDMQTGSIHMEGPMDHKEKDKWDDMVKKFADLENNIIHLQEYLNNPKNKKNRELIESDLKEETEFYNMAYNAVGQKAYVVRNKAKYKRKRKNKSAKT
jgi:Family of unknown function (DUF5681)